MPKSQNLTLPSSFKHQVRRLDIAMHNPFAVCVVERPGGLFRYLPDEFARQRRPSRHQFVERDSSNVLHRDVGESILLADPVDGHDARMRERPGRARLPEKLVAQELAVGGVVDLAEPDDLDCDETADQRVECAIDHARSSPSDLFDDLVRP